MTHPPTDDLAALRIDRTAPRARRGWMLPVLALVALVGAVALYLAAPGRGGPQVRTGLATVVGPAASTESFTATGYVVAQRSAAVSSKATGRLVYLGVEEGDRVVADQVLGRVESDDVEAALARAEADLEVTRAALAEAEARRRKARVDLDRSERLVAQELVAREDHDRIVADVEVADAAVASAEASIRAAEATVRTREVEVESTRIRAPFDGTVLTKTADVGEMVAPLAASTSSRGAVVTLADMASLEVEADVSESRIERVRRGAPVEIVLDAYPDRRYRGRVKTIVPTADRAKATVLTKISFVDRDDRVLPEMSARATFLDEEPVEGLPARELVVPVEAVVDPEGRPRVYLVVDGGVEERSIRPGPVRGTRRVVLEGLSAGDRVVLDPPPDLATGSPVRWEERT